MGRTKQSVDRRKFLKSAVAGAAALATPAGSASELLGESSSSGDATSSFQTTDSAPPGSVVVTERRVGSDFMVDVIKSLGFEFVCSNPCSPLRGLHESLINYGGNQSPEWITCLHEESAVAMGHGYAKIEGKPLGVLAYSSVGLQHAAMAVYNAYCDRVPVYLILGNTIDATTRRPGVDWNHCVQDAAAMVREFVKWDDLPISLPHFAESAVRAYKLAMTPPRMPVALVVDSELQENVIPSGTNLRIPKLTVPTPPQGDSGSVAEAARLLVGAQNPVIVVDRAARTQDGVNRLVELAELIQAPVFDQTGRMNFPSRHPLNQTADGHALIANADVILGLELTTFFGTVNSYKDQPLRTTRPLMKPDAKLIGITLGDLFMKSNYQDIQPYTEVQVGMAADVEATLPALIEAVRRQITPNRKALFQDRGAKFALARQRQLQQARTDASYAWDASPISTARLCAELWGQIENEDWSLVSATHFEDFWPQRLWSFDKYYQYIGGHGGGGEGYGAPAAVGAALANRKHGRLTVNIQCDGDLMYGSGVLWTAAHHRIPILNIMHNNRAYHGEVMQLQRMCNRRNRGIDRSTIGTVIDNPAIDFAKLAQSMGVYAEGPITDPKDVGPAIRRAIAVVKRGEPALIDVLTQPQ